MIFDQLDFLLGLALGGFGFALLLGLLQLRLDALLRRRLDAGDRPAGESEAEPPHFV